MTGLALHFPIEDLLIPPSAYLHDRTLSRDIHAPYASGRRAFGARQAFPVSTDGKRRLPRVLREASSFMLMGSNIETEGLFRISPHSRLVDVLREAYDRGQKFIIWREGDIIVCYPEPANDSYPSIEDMSRKEGYGIHLAAGLIKLWYSKLREPIFPQTTYRHLRNLSADDESPIEFDRLRDLISPDSKWSPLSAEARSVLATHLLPLLSTVAAHEESNKMSPYNLAICFAPALFCGPDAIEDARMGATIRRVLEAMISQWNPGLRDACNVDVEDFSRALRAPSRPTDYEDPLIPSVTDSSTEQDQPIESDPQLHGITLEDNEIVVASDEDGRPPLPPRRRSSTQGNATMRSRSEATVGSSDDFRPTLPPRQRSTTPERSTERSHIHRGVAKRKPAPTVAVPPRYSLAILEGNGQYDSSIPNASDTQSTPAPNPWAVEPTSTSPGTGDGRAQNHLPSIDRSVPARKPVKPQEPESLI